MEYKIITFKELESGDRIIHNYRQYLVSKCGFGQYAGIPEWCENGWLQYFWVEGRYVYNNEYNNNEYDDSERQNFWSHPNCPVIKCI